MNRKDSNSQKYLYATNRLLLTIFYLETVDGVWKDSSQGANSVISFGRHSFIYTVLMH